MYFVSHAVSYAVSYVNYAVSYVSYDSLFYVQRQMVTELVNHLIDILLICFVIICFLTILCQQVIFLQEGRYLEVHGQGGKIFSYRIPRFCRDLALHQFSSDLYIAASGSVIRNNLDSACLHSFYFLIFALIHIQSNIQIYFNLYSYVHGLHDQQVLFVGSLTLF